MYLQSWRRDYHLAQNLEKIDLPYRAEYAKSGRAVCRGCIATIAKDVLRLAVIVQSPVFDGKIPNWYHERCFFTHHQPKTTDDIAHFESLRCEDQEKIRSNIRTAGSLVVVPVPTEKSKKRNAADATTKKTALKDFVLEYSKSNRAACRRCDQKIMKGEIRISKNDFETDVGKRYDGKDMWHHLTCFAELRSELEYDECGDKLPGFKTLSAVDRAKVKTQLPNIKQDVPEKKLKVEDDVDGNKQTEIENKIKSQSNIMFGYRDKSKQLKKRELQTLLKTNRQWIPRGEERILDRLADVMAFGALERCKQCKTGQFKFGKLGYMCQGNLTPWTKCRVITKAPERFKFTAPTELAEKYSFLKEYQYVPCTRVIRDVNPTVFHSLTNIEKSEATSSKIESKSHSGTDVSSKVMLKLKNAGAVDPDWGLADKAQIYQCDGEKYTAILGLTDIQKQRNKYYKLQLLESDSQTKFWFFRSWGRIGTTIGGNKVESLTLVEAKLQFRKHYLQKSGNKWEYRHSFVKKPGLMYPIDIDSEDKAELDINIEFNVSSKLLQPVQDLVSLIFDVNMMKKVMLEFELDTERMPLGKLSKSQLQNAYLVLSELQHLVEFQASLAYYIDASNRFYTLVPHSFGIENPPVINDAETIKKKIEMVENLMKIEIAYNLMKSIGSDNSIDDLYGKLGTEIDVLQQDTNEFKIISEYVKNTHSETHVEYDLEIQDVFTIKRQGEEERYKPFHKLHNRRLLWHGSRTTNYAGILSQGLRIAPPEAPVTGYMFGKGIYFADMVSKSANYCFTSPNNSTGILLLCEVALGEMLELRDANSVKKLPTGRHSVKGVGRTEPDPTVVKELQDGVQVPMGKGVVLDKNKQTSLLYNEFVVYDAAQVNIKYLLKMNFKYKY